MATITGTSGSEVIFASPNDDVTTGAGQDTIFSSFSSFPSSAKLTVEDFTPGPGGDVLVLSNGAQPFPGFHVGGDPFVGGTAILQQQGADTVLTIFEPSGSLIDTPVAGTVLFKNVLATSLTTENIATQDGLGNITVHFGSEVGNHVGTSGPDQLAGGATGSVLNGGGGNDTTIGGDANDTHFGGAGDDVLADHRGDDRLDGGDGNDTLWGGDGNDVLVGGAGNDYLIGQAGDDAMTGGAGADTFWVGRGDAGAWIYDFNVAEGDRVAITSLGNAITIFKPAGLGVDVVQAIQGDGTQTITLQGASLDLGDWLVVPLAETMFGGDSGNEVLTGGSNNDVLVDGAGSAVMNGGAGNDTLWGGAGTDYLYGGAGNDRLIGQAGTNLITGGSGADQFVVTTADTSDWIVDYSKAEGDRVLLPGGVTFTMAQFDFGVAVALSTGQQIGIQGATVAGLGSDWFAYY